MSWCWNYWQYLNVQYMYMQFLFAFVLRRFWHTSDILTMFCSWVIDDYVFFTFFLWPITLHLTYTLDIAWQCWYHTQLSPYTVLWQLILPHWTTLWFDIWLRTDRQTDRHAHTNQRYNNLLLQDYNDCDYGHIIYINNTIYLIYVFQWPTEQVLTKYKWYSHIDSWQTCQIYDTTDMRHVRYMTQQIWDMSDIWLNRYETCQIYDTTDKRHVRYMTQQIRDMSDIWLNR